MKINCLLASTFCLLISIVSAQPTLEWAKSSGGSGYDFAYSSDVDANGNMYNTGVFQNTADFDPGAGIYNLTSSGEYDIIIQKLDINGNFIWAKSLGSSLTDRGLEIMVAQSGDVYITGYFQGTVDFNPGAGSANLTSSGLEDAFLLKLDANGNYLWSQKMSSSTTAKGYSIVEDNLGNVLVSGFLAGNYFIQKFNSSGSTIWVKSLAPSQLSSTNIAIALDNNNNIYLTGGFLSTMDADPGVGVVNLVSLGGWDIFFIKLDNNGDFVFAQSLGSTSHDIGRSIAIDNLGNPIIAGSYNATMDFDWGPVVTSSTSLGNSDNFILKLDSSGNYVWHKVFGGSSYETPIDLVLDANNNMYITGEFTSTTDFDPGVGVSNLTAAGTMLGVDIYILKLTNNGDYSWAVRFGEADVDDSGMSIDLSVTGEIYVSGIYSGTVDFDPGAGTSNLTAAGSYDFCFLKFSECSSTSITHDVATLSPITDECSLAMPVAPSATNNCGVAITGVPDLTFPITTQGTTAVTWTYDDGNGNTSTQMQNVVITDATPPLADLANLPDINNTCEVTSLTAPTATDNCAGLLTGSHNASLPITTQGTTTVTWTYNDGNGNTLTQTQNVVITDATIPLADLADLPDINDECEVTPTAPTATDNCSGAITGTPDLAFPITASGTTMVTWTYDDGNGNTLTQTQNVIITPIDNGITQVDALTLSADATGYTYQWLDCDNGNAAVSGATNQSFTPTIAGNYACEINNGTCSVTTACLSSSVGINEKDFGSSLIVYPNPTFGNVSIDLGSTYSEAKIFVYNNLGQQVLNKTVNNSSTIDLTIEGAAGIYTIEVQTKEGRSARILVVKQ
ncbi:MAG: T9SS type A sorting domain-containing protein [Flavobacteriales bacterium]|nr:T9SS type A sorting domain-containing protein [Flavobacteriales bacterium]